MRPTKDAYFAAMARLASTRSTCLRRAVGCVLVDARGHVLSTGYNGVAAGMPHCNQLDPFDPTGTPYACEGAHLPSGTGLDRCEAIHAEQNALLQCRDVHTIDTCYCTLFPCVTCVKLLLNTGCRRIAYSDAYQPEHQAAAEGLWLRSGRLVERVAS